MRCHFVYSAPQNTGLPARLRRRFARYLQGFGLSVSAIGDRSRPDFSRWPVRSPYENTRNTFLRLSRRVPTLLYSLDEQSRGRIEAGDILIGHPRFPYRPGRPGQTELLLRRKGLFQKTALISPVHCDTAIDSRHINASYLDSIDRLIPEVDVFFAIMGPYWGDRWKTGPYAHWLPKLVRLDMAIDAERYPRVKKRFNPPGRRGFFFVGRNDPMKGVDFLAELFAELGDSPRGWIGAGPDIPGVPRISAARPLDPDFMSEIAKDFDFFVNASKADPNPTTILESMAWGFPVVCTPQSGYYENSYRLNIHREDKEGAVQTLRALQTMEEDRLLGMAEEARRVVLRDYTWDKFADVICRHMGLDES